MYHSKQSLLTGRDLTLIHRWAASFSNAIQSSIAIYRPDGDKWESILQFQYDTLNNEILSEQLSGSEPEECRLIFGTTMEFPFTGPLDDQSMSIEQVSADGLPEHTFYGRLPNCKLIFAFAFGPTTTVNPSHLSALALALWNSIQANEHANNARIQSQAFVQQVTQDFEELTWLRGLSQQIGGIDLRSSIAAIASIQLPLLRNVIRSEMVAYIPISTEGLASHGPSSFFDSLFAGDTREPITYAGQLIADSDSIFRFVQAATKTDSRKVCVFNVQSAGEVFGVCPAVRNCVIARVETSHRHFGYLLAANKEMEFIGESPEDFMSIDPNGFQFGTFEAGLLGSLATVLASHATNGELFQEQEKLLTGVVRAVINAIDAKDPYTCGHSDRVAAFAKSIAAEMGFDEEECTKIYMAGLLHDVGKIGIPDSILGKPGKLTDEEFEIVKKHPEIGHNILSHLKPLSYVLPGVLHHHEAVRGQGYPHGLVGEQIPLYGRILAVADSYDAMTSNRPYRDGMPSEKAELILRKEAGVIWDEQVVAAMLRCIENGQVSPQSKHSPPSYQILETSDLCIIPTKSAASEFI